MIIDSSNTCTYLNKKFIVWLKQPPDICIILKQICYIDSMSTETYPPSGAGGPIISYNCLSSPTILFLY